MVGQEPERLEVTEEKQIDHHNPTEVVELDQSHRPIVEEAAEFAGEVDHFFDTDGPRAVETLASGERAVLIETINELGEIAFATAGRDDSVAESDVWKLRDLLNKHQERGAFKHVRLPESEDFHETCPRCGHRFEP
jgi:hypothetical protein